jgi:hypothetical protein
VSAGCRGRWLRRNARTSPTGGRGGPATAWSLRSLGSGGRPVPARVGAAASSRVRGSRCARRAMWRCLARCYSPTFVATFPGIPGYRSCETGPCSAAWPAGSRTNRTSPQSAQRAEHGLLRGARKPIAKRTDTPESRTSARTSLLDVQAAVRRLRRPGGVRGV